MTKISTTPFEPALITIMKTALESASAHLEHSAGRPATSATKAKMASRILKSAAEGETDVTKLQSVAIEEGLCPAD